MSAAVLQLMLASGGAGPAAIQGTLAAIEGADLAALTGSALSNALSATEGADTAALTGSVLILGSMAATEGADIAALSGVAIGEWEPIHDADLFIWYKGSDLSGTNGDTVATWPDAAGSNDATSGTITLDTTGLNGFNVVDGVGTAAAAQKINLPNVWSGVLTSGAVFAVVKADADPSTVGTGDGSFIWNSSANFTTGGGHYPLQDGVIYDGTGSSTRKTIGNPTPSLASWHIVAIGSAASDYRHNLNGTQIFATGTNTVGWSTTPNLFFGQASRYYAGKMAEIFFFDTSGEFSLKKAEGYLAHRFAITSVLPTNHPYKTVSPETGTFYATLDGLKTNATLSNGNLTAKHTNTTSNSGARSTSYRKSGKYYFEVTCDAVDANNDVLGVCTSGATFTNVVGGTNGAYCFRNTGVIYGNNISSGKTVNSGTNLTAGNVIGVAVDLDNNKVWFRLCPSGDWQSEAIGSQDPASNVGGVSISSYIALVLAPVVGFNTDIDTQFTCNFGQSTFSGTVPSGFTAGWLE